MVWPRYKGKHWANKMRQLTLQITYFIFRSRVEVRASKTKTPKSAENFISRRINNKPTLPTFKWYNDQEILAQAALCAFFKCKISSSRDYGNTPGTRGWFRLRDRTLAVKKIEITWNMGETNFHSREFPRSG